MISSSKRVIKQPERLGSGAIETYLPPTEQFFSSRVTPRAPVFPRYTPEGVKADDLELALKETASTSPEEEEVLGEVPEHSGEERKLERGRGQDSRGRQKGGGADPGRGEKTGGRGVREGF